MKRLSYEPETPEEALLHMNLPMGQPVPVQYLPFDPRQFGGIEGAPISIGNYQFTPIYHSMLGQQGGFAFAVPPSAQSLIDKRRSGAGPKRGDYKCGKCGHFPKKDKHNCAEIIEKKGASLDDTKRPKLAAELINPPKQPLPPLQRCESTGYIAMKPLMPQQGMTVVKPVPLAANPPQVSAPGVKTAPKASM